MLTDAQIKEFDEQGYLYLPDLFTPEEVTELFDQATALKDSDSPQRVMERDGELVRAVYGVHLLHPVFERLTRDARALEPARELLRSDVYIHQTQLNPKAPFKGDVWEWHQDFLYWHRDDGMPGPQVLSVAVFLDDVTEFNGPIFIIPGSHTDQLHSETSTYAEGWESAAMGFRHRVDNETLTSIMNRNGLVSKHGRKGSVLIFAGQVLHCSPPNLSAGDRTILFIRYNAIGNALEPIENPRPEWVASRDFQVVTASDQPLLSENAG
ncbi:phytanoyl-CoA dioxygenase family protein [Kitasatospora sp. NPDC093806]|uniref:phytanoyl-CoA dioxygenase family protein n=1 Tax=Kitasatospora sp. NPDC093806 TaxID=3155075 RepID=UPI00344730BD